MARRSGHANRRNKTIQRLCRAWLIRHDSEAADFWRAQPEGSDFVGAVIDNVNQFGPDETGQADFALGIA